ncbi:MAG: helix-turn-helix domain-containing protein [Chloroflexi bacterium]|nr:helix-turn-helix domain-containing protein [Chloroflexota bacterium]
MSKLVLNTKLLKRNIPNVSKAARNAGIRSATIFDLYRGKTRIEHAEVRMLKALADLAGCTMDELIVAEPEPAETFAASIRRWASLPEQKAQIAGPKAGTPSNEEEDIALLKRLPLARDRGAASPKPVGRYAT